MAVLKRLVRNLGIHLKLRDPPSVPAHGWAYFDHLVAVYVNLNSADPRADAVIKKAKDDADALTWGDIFLLENTIFSLQPPEIIERTAWILRERLRQTASPAVYDKYLESSPPPKDVSSPGKLALLRADLTRVLDLLHWQYALAPIWEGKRKWLTISCVWLIVIYTIVLTTALYFFRKYHWDFGAMLLCVLYCGVVGGFVSSQRRMQDIPTDTEPLISIFGLDSAGYFLWLSPLLGAIFAVVLTAMFIGGILKGTIFPEFYTESAKNTGIGLMEFTLNTLPKGAENFAKLCVWAFLAGFAERLVPDSLDRLTKLAAEKGPGGSPPPPGGGGGALHGPENGGPSAGVLPAVQKSPVGAETIENALHTGIVSASPGGGATNS